MNTKCSADRKPYASPTLVRHGDAVEKTLGSLWHRYYEWWGYSYYGQEPRV